MLTMSVSGKSWQLWPMDDTDGDGEPGDDENEDASPNSPRSNVTVSSLSPVPMSVSGTATPLAHSPPASPRIASGDDVLKLPRRDMKIYGLCPVQDDFVLVVCDACGHSVKIEAFQEHVRLRHDRRVTLSRPVKSANVSSLSLRSCTVELTKEDLPLKSSTSSSASSTASSGATSSQSQMSLVNIRPSPSPSPVSLKEEGINHSTDAPSRGLKSSGVGTKDLMTNAKKFVGEDDADGGGTSNHNVISIPDTEPLPHSMSTDLMAMVSGDVSNTSKINMGLNIASSTTSSIQLSGISPLIKLEPGDSSNHSVQEQSLASAESTPNTLSAKRPSPKKSGSGRGERKPMREYDPDKHCGVWDNDAKRHCTRALTCKSHSVLLKRKIPGRSKPFNELVAEHKASKEAAANAQRQVAGLMPAPLPPQSSNLVTTVTTGKAIKPPAAVPITVEGVLTSISEPNPIETTSARLINSVKHKLGSQGAWSPIASAVGVSQSPKTVTAGLSSPPYISSAAKRIILSREPDENLHYTIEHPKPLAVCTFGAKRLGGLLVTDRNHMLTRKLVRVAIAGSGLRMKNRFSLSANRFHPLNQVTSVGQNKKNGQTNYLVNYTVTPTVVASPGTGNLAVNKRSFSVTAGGNVSRLSGITLATLPNASVHGAPGSAGSPQIHLNPTSEGSFKTDIQDFKGGIKFELGRKIKHILPTEITK